MKTVRSIALVMILCVSSGMMVNCGGRSADPPAAARLRQSASPGPTIRLVKVSEVTMVDDVKTAMMGEFRVSNGSDEAVELLALEGESEGVLRAHLVMYEVFLGESWWRHPLPIDGAPLTVLLHAGEEKIVMVNLFPFETLDQPIECRISIGEYWSEPFSSTIVKRAKK